ncbi:PAS domain S-box protein [Vibrio sp. T187]|uniref:methyl-accepting chemotaxis protein n=1 Tax=Vibrio TaxID=662 RepID=UPI0010C95D3C|nr:MULTISPECIES: PAS domain-containing methyl-accepting chemotaxis protein [Vibrio]MBW3698133.1 PAS domain S-box protein [Vibrio sp. T187]
MKTEATRNRNFSATDNLISTTTPESHITYVNQAFCNVAGYEQEELLNEPHNLVRHADMPKSAFQQMWQYLSSGKNWMGLVKNKCKGGEEHYWVSAFVTPIKDENDNIIEYQSVRSRASDPQIERAESLYQKLTSNRLCRDHRLSTLKALWALTLCNLIAAPALIALDAFPLPLLTGINLATLLCVYQHNRRYKSVSTLAKETYDNELVEHVYTGYKDDFSQIQLALLMKKAELRAVSARAEDTTSQILISAEEEFATIQTISERIDAQCQETEQVATAVEELTHSINEVATSALSASDLTTEASIQSKQGLTSILDTISVVDSLAQELEQSQQVINQLAEDSQKIESILDVISTISDQTNLLALNAAIEAARAGEAGRGFAVVADEVRNLASKTGSSASEIHAMISQLQATAEKAVQTMQRGGSLSVQCKQQAGLTGEVLEQIYDKLEKVTDSSHQIANAVDEQSQVTKEVNMNVVKIRELALSTADTSSHSIARTSKLVDDIEQLQRLMNQFSRI